MTLNIQRAGDITASTRYKFFLHGNSGAGKTWTACTAPKPLVVLTEPQGLHTIQVANPDAGVVQCTKLDQVRAVVRAALDGQLSKAGYETLVFDSLTEIQRMFKDEIMQGRPSGADFTMRDWGDLGEKMRRLTRTIRDLDYHIVCTAMAQSQYEEETGKRHYWPMLQGSFGTEVLGFFTVGAYLYTLKDADENIIHNAMVSGPSSVVCKPSHPLIGILQPDVTVWIEALRTKVPIEKPVEEEPEAELKTKNKKGSKK